MLGIQLACVATFALCPLLQDVRPSPVEAVLRAGELELRPVRVLDEVFDELEVDGVRLRFGASWIARADRGADVERWRVALEADAPPRWLGASAGIGLFAEHDGVARLDLDQGVWLEPLVLPPAPTAKLVGEPAGVLEVEGATWLLVRWYEGNAAAGALVLSTLGRLAAWSVASYAADAVEPVWVHAEEARGDRPPLAAGMLAPRRPNAFTRTERGVVVCAGEREDLVCFALTGDELEWRLERLWEYERGFIGPSVWDHYLGRFREEPSFGRKDDEARRERIAQQRRAFDDLFTCALVAGPVVVRRARSTPRSSSQEVLLVVLASGPVEWSAGYLSEFRVYEVGADGRPLAVSPLVRGVNGWQQYVEEHAVVWGGPSTSFVRIGSSNNDGTISMGSDGDDALARIEWYRELEFGRPDAWLVCAPARDVVACERGIAWRPAGGLYVLEREDQRAHLPLWRIELASGAARLVTLEIPTDGPFTAPRSHYRFARGRFEQHGPWQECIGLTLDCDRLRIALKGHGGAHTLEFDVSALDDESH